MPRIPALLSLLTALCGLTACGGGDSSSHPQPGRVAVLNILRVSDSIGRGKIMQAAMNGANQEISAKLQAMAKEFGRQIEAERAKVSKPEDMQKLQQLDAQLQQRYQQEIANGRTRLAALSQTLTAQLRADVRPFAQRIAEERGMSIVMEGSEGMMYISDDCEITDEVIEAMQAAGFKETAGSSPTGGHAPTPQTHPAPATGPATRP